MTGPIEQGALILGGERTESPSGDHYAIHSPATGEVIGRAPAANGQDLERAVANACEAFAAWSVLSAYQRETILREVTRHVREQAREIGRLMALEQGKPWNQGESEVRAACDLIDFYASEAPRIEGFIPPTEASEFRSWVTYQPVGVCAAITPWNYPVALLSWKLGPALAAGCAVVVKPTPVTPLCATAFCAALHDGGLPGGLINVLTGPSPELGEALVTHPMIDKVAMTGSTEVGKRILSATKTRLPGIGGALPGDRPRGCRPRPDRQGPRLQRVSQWRPILQQRQPRLRPPHRTRCAH